MTMHVMYVYVACEIDDLAVTREMPSSNPGRIVGYPEWGFFFFPPSPAVPNLRPADPRETAGKIILRVPKT